MKPTTTNNQAADGTELFTRTWDLEDAAGDVLLVHGISEHSGRWEHVAEFFVARGYAAHAYDQRGHGHSGGPRIDVMQFDQYVDDLERMVRKVQRSDRPLIIYGHSMGGLVTTLYSESNRPQPDLFVFSAPALDASVPAALKLAAKVVSRIAPGFRLKSSWKGEDLSRDPAIGEAYFSDPLVDLAGTARLGASFFAAMVEGRDDIGRIKVPTLVVHGTDDPIVPPACSAPLAGVPGVERRLFPGMRHEVHNELEKEEVLSFVAGWIDQRLGAQA